MFRIRAGVAPGPWLSMGLIVAAIVVGGVALGQAYEATAFPSAQEPEEHAPQEPSGDPAQEDDHAAVQDDSHGAADESHEAEPKAWYYWPAKWFNFIALVGLLYWMLVIPPQPVQDIFSYPGLKVIFTERSAGILAARDLASEQTEEAGRLLTDSDVRLAKIEEEVAALVNSGREDAEREAQRAAEDGKKQAEKILQVAEREVTNERVGAQRQLRRHVADLAVKLAEGNLAEHLTADDQDRLIREYLSRLGTDMA